MKTNGEGPCSDGQLLERFKNGDQQAFALIYDRYASELIDFSSRKLSSLEEARDLVHDLFVGLWEKRGQVNISSSFRSYLFAAIRYKVIDHIRRNIRQDYYAGIAGTLDINTDNSTNNDILYRNFNEIMESEIEKLPPRTKEIFRLSRQQHLSVREIAGKLSLSDQTVKNQLSAALKKLKPSFERLIPLLLFFF